MHQVPKHSSTVYTPYSHLFEKMFPLWSSDLPFAPRVDPEIQKSWREAPEGGSLHNDKPMKGAGGHNAVGFAMFFL